MYETRTNAKATSRRPAVIHVSLGGRFTRFLAFSAAIPALMCTLSSLGDHVGYTLGMDLFRAAMGSQRHLPLSDRHNDESEGGHIGSGEGGGASDGDGFIERWGGTRGVDCELLVAGSYLHAHRVVLARRSPVLRDMIAQVSWRHDKHEKAGP